MQMAGFLAIITGSGGGGYRKGKYYSLSALRRELRPVAGGQGLQLRLSKKWQLPVVSPC